MGIYAAIAALIVWAVGFVSGARRASRRAAKRAITPVPDYDVTNPINCKFSEYVGRSDYGTDWYLPTVKELDIIYDLRYVIDAVLVELNFEKISIVDYWTSCERHSYAAVVKGFQDKKNNTIDKYSTNNVRAVLAY